MGGQRHRLHPAAGTLPIPGAVGAQGLDFLRNVTWAIVVALWSWKTRFAKSTPVIASFSLPSSPLRGLQHHHLGTLRCRLERTAATPSEMEDEANFYLVREDGGQIEAKH
jgi:hypothetical protein